MPLAKHQIIPELLQACPELQTAWSEHVTWWQGEVAGDYNDASAIVHALIEFHDQGEVAFFPRFFACVEHFIIEGDEEVRNIAVLGYLETLQTAASWKESGSEVFVTWLLPESKKWWVQIHKWWEGGKSLMDIVVEEARQSRNSS